MKNLLKSKLFICLISVWIAVSIFSTIYFEQPWWLAILFVLSFGGVVALIDPLVTPILVNHNKKVAKEQAVINKQILAAITKHGKKGFLFGKKKQHIIYATNKIVADKIWNTHFSKKHQEADREYYWITTSYNNLSK